MSPKQYREEAEVSIEALEALIDSHKCESLPTPDMHKNCPFCTRVQTLLSLIRFEFTQETSK